MVKQWRGLAIVMSLALLISLVASPGTIQADSGSAKEGYSWFVELPGDAKKAASLQKQLEQGKTPVELGLTSGKTGTSPLRSLSEVQKEDAKAQQTYDVKLDPPIKINKKWTPPRFQYDYISKEECLDNIEASGKDEGWIKNHFAWCRSKIVSYGWQRYRFPYPFPITYGVQYRVTEIGYGTNSQDKDKQEREVNFDYYIDDIYTTHPFLNASKLTVDIDCNPLIQPEDCKESESTSKIERTIAQWRINNFGRKTLYSTPPPKTDDNPERIGYMEFFTHQVMDPPQFPTRTLDSPKQKVRWDSADYMKVIDPNQTFYNAGIFSNVRPIIHFSLSDPSVMQEQAQHIKDALEHPEKTYPYPGEGKIIPGGKYSLPLTRLKDKSSIRKNRRKSQYWCKKLSNEGVIPKPANSECDEFPFASTWQGSATGGEGKYSVRYINKDSNQAGGTWLGAWYAYDRILNEDPFNVRVNP
ncbi:hypothetical protein GCM10011571_17030 [Marinithermofilum abyssi]|uniref:Deoxyribonuclease NucA/NucB domain-containing protein n=1 Tax=Marinithermofilum abyssi TaxID=1571185 RepID=A0A8J2VIG8_9BACL|nr:NucA/NucB deoxyribonuclease domain-containing protein [Marinithermofilum abyssi]GGE16012.1 hypothetical protein GCM10011571_17030 [Marinithermofilum abyssi]